MRAATLVCISVVLLGACTSDDVEKVADNPRVKSVVELEHLIQEGTGECQDPETPVAIQFPGLERAMCKVADEQITLTVRTNDEAPSDWDRGFESEETGSNPSRLKGPNWVVVGQEEALVMVEEAIGGMLASE